MHRFVVFLAAYTVLLITAGGLVKSLEAGLSVPDWPLSYGSLNPPRWWEIETIRAEHGHRLIAGGVLLMTLGLTVWFALREPRRWVRRIAYLALTAVIGQAVLGGVTVLFFLPTPVSVSHAALAQLFLCLLVTLAVATSRFWASAARPRRAGEAIGRVAGLATASTALIFVQIVLGAVMRHTGAGLAIPDFPLAFGGLVPPRMDFAIGVHYAHRLGALLVATAIFWTLGRVLRFARREKALLTPAWILALLVLAQGALGASVVLTGKSVLPNTLHVGGGALLLATSLALTLSSHRLAWVERQEQEAVSVAPAGVPELEGAAS
jgi:cytochrome c oxidase assembly protein subunit 15